MNESVCMHSDPLAMPQPHLYNYWFIQTPHIISSLAVLCVVMVTNQEIREEEEGEPVGEHLLCYAFRLP